MSQGVEKFKTTIGKKFGEEFVYYAGEAPPVEVVSTGSIQLDFASGIGGLPRGRVVEVYGPESIGKTALAYYMIREEQLAGRPTLFINLEGNFDPIWAQKVAGIDISATSKAPLLVINPANGKEAVEIAGSAAHAGEFGMVVFDSIGAMLGEKEAKPGEEKQAGGQSALVTHMVKMVTVPAERNKTTMVFINQIRDAFSHIAYQKPPGGHAVKHMAAIRIHLRPGGDRYDDIINGDKVQTGFSVKAKFVKNKAAAAQSNATWNFWQRPVKGFVGIDRMQEIIDLSFNYDVIPHTGGGYYQHPTFPLDDKGLNRLRSKDSVIEFLRENESATEQVRMELMQLARGAVAEEDKVEV